MADSPNAIQLRPAADTDETFLLELYKSSRGADVRELGWDEQHVGDFLEMQYQAQQRFFENEYQQADNQIIVREGKPIGRLLVDRRNHEIRCVDIALMPEHRNGGIGSTLLRALQNEAKQICKPLRLQIIRFNRAVNLLERLGFVRTSETGTHFQMEWVP
jgi:GNAT superfamily N-acetyltransferase